MACVFDFQLLVVSAPEERDVVESVAPTEHVARDDLTLTLGNDPVLDAEAHIGIRIGPTGDIAGAENPANVRLEKLINRETVVDRKASFLSEFKVRSDADAGDNEVCVQARTVIEYDALLVNALDRLPEVELDALLLVHAFYERTDISSHHPLERDVFQSNDADLEAARHQRGGDLESNEAGADHYCLLRGADSIDDGSTVAQGAEIEDALAARNIQLDRSCSCRNEQAAVGAGAAITQLDGLRFHIELDGSDTQKNLDVLRLIEFPGMQRQPFLGRIPRQIIL